MKNYTEKLTAVFGSTGSIGRQTLDVMERLGMRPFALSCGKNAALLEEQIRRFRPLFASVADEKAARDLAVRAADTETRILGGENAAGEIAAMPGYDTALCAFSGVAGLSSTLAAAESGHDLALANKETLVCGGEFFLERVRKAGIRMLPV
ncbi:MAG: 1-deoxy-D-xylulose-5-phosphate reductoisomerase, partial [Clostridia bacterium]|nr:1-deoxy-D-xylulose-5-phosphate reductoisomerase [Clostridia bacterium]